MNELEQGSPNAFDIIINFILLILNSVQLNSSFVEEFINECQFTFTGLISKSFDIIIHKFCNIKSCF